MTSIAWDDADAGTVKLSGLAAGLKPMLRRLAARRRLSRYPTVRRRQREAMFSWAALVAGHSTCRF